MEQHHDTLTLVTTEDLKAICQNYPDDPIAGECALELERRIGSNVYSGRIWDRFAR